MKTWTSLNVFRPEIEYYTVYDPGVKSPEEVNGQWLYNHCSSIEFFDGRYVVAWNGGKHFKENSAGNVLLYATSPDLKEWSEPIVMTSPDVSKNPIRTPKGIQWQPNLFHVGDELWCLWCITVHGPKNAPMKNSGTWLSRLSPGEGAKWQHEMILDRYEHEGLQTLAFPGQNPEVLPSGRIVSAATFIGRSEDKSVNKRWVGALYSDDLGKSWEISNLIAPPDHEGSVWEPLMYALPDGTMRGYIRNMPPRLIIDEKVQRYTFTATGTEKDSDLILSEPVFDPYDTANCRPDFMRLDDNRFVLIQHDSVLNHRDYDSRYNLSIFLSRTGNADYVAGIPFSRKNEIATYPWGIQHDNDIVVSYTAGTGRQPRSIVVAKINKPDRHKLYIWPRDREKLDLHNVQAKDFEGNSIKQTIRRKPDYQTQPFQTLENGDLLFHGESSTGVELPVGTGETAFTFRFKLQEKASFGFLHLMTFGDRIPFRLAIPANRPDEIWVYSINGWEKWTDFNPNEFQQITFTANGNSASLVLNNNSAAEFALPVNGMSPKLYLGRGWDFDYVRDPLQYDVTGIFIIEAGSVATR